MKLATVNPTLGPQLGDVGDSMHAIKNSTKVTSCSMNRGLQKHQKLTQSKYYMKVEKNLYFLLTKERKCSSLICNMLEYMNYLGHPCVHIAGDLQQNFHKKQQKFTQICFKNLVEFGPNWLF